MVDVSQYKVGIILDVAGCGNHKTKNGKALKVCKVNVGEKEPVMIVTSASNVREGSRVAVALAGTTYLNSEGEQVPVKKATIAGTASEGILCDSRMLGWSGGGSGVAAQIPYGIDPGSAPPATKPRPKDDEPKPPKIKVDPLFEKKLTKEEKKKLAEEKRRARKAAKEEKKAKEERANSEPSGNQ